MGIITPYCPTSDLFGTRFLKPIQTLSTPWLTTCPAGLYTTPDQCIDPTGPMALRWRDYQYKLTIVTTWGYFFSIFRKFDQIAINCAIVVDWSQPNGKNFRNLKSVNKSSFCACKGLVFSTWKHWRKGSSTQASKRQKTLDSCRYMYRRNEELRVFLPIAGMREMPAMLGRHHFARNFRHVHVTVTNTL